METPVPAPVAVGARLKAWRTAANLTLAAAASSVGVKHPTWCEWESGTRCPSLEKALAIELVTLGEVSVEAWGFDVSLVKTMASVLGARNADPKEAA